MVYDALTFSMLMLALWALGMAVIVGGAKPTPRLVVKHPVGFAPPVS